MAEIAATQFKDLVSDALDSKADYNIVLHYTALPERFGCKICAEFHSDMGYVAKAAVQGERKTYFLSSDTNTHTHTHTHYITLHYTTLHYTTLHTTHYTLHTTHYTLHTTHYTLHTILHYTTLHYTLHYTTLHYTLKTLLSEEIKAHTETHNLWQLVN